MDSNRKLIVAWGLVAFFLALGTIFYHLAEGWSYVDAFYFTGITLLTIGYGDLAPTTAVTRVFTVFFALIGIGTVLYCIGIIAQRYVEREEDRLARLVSNVRTAAAKNPALQEQVQYLKERAAEFSPISRKNKER